MNVNDPRTKISHTKRGGRDATPVPATKPLDSPGPQEQLLTDPLGSSFTLLAEHNRRAPKNEAQRVQKNLESGYEALVKMKAEGREDVIFSVRDASEVPLYAALVSGQSTGEESLQNLFAQLDSAEKAKTDFYLPRKSELLSTDAAAAAIALKRGSRVVVRRADGKHQEFQKPEAVQAFLSLPLDKDSAQAMDTIRRADKAGMTLSVHPEPGEEKTGRDLKTVVSALMANLEASKKSDLEFDGELIEALKARKAMDVSFKEDERPLALPTTLDADGFASALQWETEPSDKMTAFAKEFARLEEDKMLLMARQTSGQLKGTITRADARSAFLSLNHGNDVVALDKKGDLHRLKSLGDFEKLARTGRVSEAAAPFDGNKTDSENLFMMYHVAPFDPVEKGILDDLPLRLTEVGSNENVDIVTMRSDLPDKRNLRIDRAQKGELQELVRLDPKTAMSDPKTLENFIYDTVSQNAGDKRIRMLVGGHGGAEKGLLPDGEHNNADANHAMAVDDFAGAFKKALDRVEKETGNRPKIDNLILVSCLMGNTSFIHALAKTGDIDVLIASPELMMGSNPTSTFEHLSRPENAKASGREFASFLAEEYANAPSAPGGDKNSHHAETVGVYDLSPEKANTFQSSLNNFFEAALKEPKFARYIKEGMANTPSYGINPLINVMFDVDNRDLYQVLDRVSGDARVSSPQLQKAIKELKAATLDQVIEQRVSKDYEGRKGPSLYMPLDRWDFNEKMAETDLLKGTKYKEFMEMVFDVPVQRSLGGAIINELGRVAESGALKGLREYLEDQAKNKPSEDKKKEAEDAKTEGVPESKSAETSGESKKPEVKLTPEEKKQAEELQDLHEMEEAPSTSGFQKAKSLLRGTLRLAGTLAGAAVGGAIGAPLIGALGLYRGIKAGLTGLSGSGTARPPEKSEEKSKPPKDNGETPKTDGAKPGKVESDKESGEAKAGSAGKTEKPEDAKDSKKAEGDDASAEPGEPKDKGKELLEALLKEADKRVLRQAAMAPMEHLAIKTHQKVGYTKGVWPARLAGGLVGAFTGPLGGALEGGLLGVLGGGMLGYKVAAVLTGFLENKPPEKGDDTFTGWEGDPPKEQPKTGESESA